MKQSLSIADLLGQPCMTHLGLNVIGGAVGMSRRIITSPRIQKSGLALAGLEGYVKEGRIQVLGASEFDFLKTLGSELAEKRLLALVCSGIPGIICTKGHRPHESVLRCCDEAGVPMLCTDSLTSDLIESIAPFLEDFFSPRIQMHGVLVDVFSKGTLILGEPGIGKSECALELIYRGHRLVADDVVVIKRFHRTGLQGSAHERLAHFLELRGVGIIDVRNHFGMTASSDSVNISLIIQLIKLSREAREQEMIRRERHLRGERMTHETQEILGIPVRKYIMAVAPGRDVALMVETAVRKSILMGRGIDDEGSFLQRIERIAAGEEI